MQDAVTPTEWEHSALSVDDQTVFGCFLNGQLVAACKNLMRSEDTADHGVVTHPHYRGRGCGKAVVSASVAHALNQGYLVIYQTLLSNAAAVKIARNLGFRQYGQSLAVRFKTENRGTEMSPAASVERSKPCTVCRIIRREIPGYIVDENEDIIVFLTLENHPVVSPKSHVPDIFALDDATGALIMQEAIRVAKAVKAGLQCDGVYLTQANGAAAGQDVLHFHLHVYPRWHDERLTRYWNDAQADDSLKQTTLEKIIGGLKKLA